MVWCDNAHNDQHKNFTDHQGEQKSKSVVCVVAAVYVLQDIYPANPLLVTSWIVKEIFLLQVFRWFDFRFGLLCISIKTVPDHAWSMGIVKETSLTILASSKLRIHNFISHAVGFPNCSCTFSSPQSDNQMLCLIIVCSVCLSTSNATTHNIAKHQIKCIHHKIKNRMH